ncbi:MAG: hypothetical protein M1820_000486 [Bogoriella megaspora]|nr:MAG: hypothetical protein M1820_000486 [Bogoriella megaspora]
MAELGIAASIIQIVGLGTKLSFSFYHLASTVATATNDVNRVARGVSLFCLMLKNVGAALRADASLGQPVHSAEALETVQEIIEQCNHVFGELKKMLDKCGWKEGEDLSKLQKVRWSVKRPKVEYVLGHLDSLKLTLAVMMQTLQTARVTAIARRMSAASTVTATSTATFDDAETVVSEKAQLENLVVEQQLSLFKAGELYGEYQASETDNKEDEKAVVPAAERVASLANEMKPAELTQYQETTLATVYTTTEESERLAAVLKIATPYADYLIQQWTVIERLKPPPEYVQFQEGFAMQTPQRKGKPAIRRIASHPERPESMNNPRNVYLNPRPSFYKNPSVEEESDEEDRLHKIRLQQGIHELDTEPSQTTRAPNSFNPPTQNLPFSREYLPNTSVQRGATSPTSAPYVPSHIAKSTPTAAQHRPSTHRNFTANDADPLYHNSAHQGDGNLGIPWRIRLRTSYWDFLDEKLMNTNMPNPGKETFSDPQIRTELSSSWICKEAIQAKDLDFTTFRVDNKDGRQGQDGGMLYFSIQCPLDLPHIKEMVQHTAQIYRNRRTSANPFSPQSSQSPWQKTPPNLGRPGSQQSPAPAVRPPEGSAPGPQMLRYSNTPNVPRAPSQNLGPESYQPRIQVERPSSSKSSPRSFNSYDSDDSYEDQKKKNGERPRSRRAGDRSKSRSAEKEKRSGGMLGRDPAKNAGKLGTIFGLAALLDGLGDI